MVTHTARCLPACRLITDVGVVAAHMERGTPDRVLKQGADPVLQNPIGRKPVCILDPLGVEEGVDLRIGKSGIGAVDGWVNIGRLWRVNVQC